MKTEQLCKELKMGQEKNKEIKDFLEFNESEYTQTYGTQWS